MHRIDTAGNIDGQFVPGNPMTGQQYVVADCDWLNDLQENVAQAVEGAGITLVKGNYAQLLAAIRALASEAIPYCTDTGAANAYVITPAPPLGAYAAGASYRVKFINANTGASTIAVSGLAPVALTHQDGTALEEGDIPAGSEGLITDDGAEFQLGQLRLPPIVRAWESAPQAVSGTKAAVANPYGLQPFGAACFLRCLTSELGYSVGDEVPMNAVTYTGAGGGTAAQMTEKYNTSEFAVSYNLAAAIELAPEGGGAGGAYITPGNWAFVFKVTFTS